MTDYLETVRIHAAVTGRVQGVGFRYFAVTQARRLHIIGWVRNRFDGAVEVEAEGSRNAVSTFVAQLKVGPEWSHVTNVDATEIPIAAPHSHGASQRFEVRMDAR